MKLNGIVDLVLFEIQFDHENLLHGLVNICKAYEAVGAKRIAVSSVNDRFGKGSTKGVGGQEEGVGGRNQRTNPAYGFGYERIETPAIGYPIEHPDRATCQPNWKWGQGDTKGKQCLSL